MGRRAERFAALFFCGHESGKARKRKSSHEDTKARRKPPAGKLAILSVIAGQEAAFERSFAEAKAIIGSMPGSISLELQRCVERANRYARLVLWAKLDDHTIGFRQSPEYRRWKALLPHFYEPFPEVEHYAMVDAE